MLKVLWAGLICICVANLSIARASAATISFSDSAEYDFSDDFTGTSGQNVYKSVLIQTAEVALPQFHPSLGTLESVLVTMGVAATTDIYYAVLSSSANIFSSAGYNVRYSSPGLITAYANDGNTSDVGPGGSFSGPTSKTFFGTDSGVDSGSEFTFTGGDVAPFVGTGSISYYILTDSFIAINANSNVGLYGQVKEWVEGSGIGTVSVEYTYTEAPAAVPEPSSLVLLGMGAGALTLCTVRRRRQNAAAAGRNCL